MSRPKTTEFPRKHRTAKEDEALSLKKYKKLAEYKINHYLWLDFE